MSDGSEARDGAEGWPGNWMRQKGKACLPHQQTSFYLHKSTSFSEVNRLLTASGFLEFGHLVIGSEPVKEIRPQMNADKRGLKTRKLSAFMRVNLRPKMIFSQLPRLRLSL